MASPKGFSVFVGIGAKLLPSLNSSATAVERRFGQMNRRLRIQAAETRVAFREMSAALKPLAGMAAAAGVSLGVAGVIKSAAAFDHQAASMKAAGMSARELAESLAAVKSAANAVPGSTWAEGLATISETRLSFGSTAHAIGNLQTNLKLKKLMANNGTTGEDADKQIGDLAKALEITGAANDPAKYARAIDNFWRAFQATGGRVNSAEYLGFAKQANPYSQGLSDDFWAKFAPSLIQEFGGERAGTMTTSTLRSLSGVTGRGGKRSGEFLQSLGLLSGKIGGNGSKTGWDMHQVRDWKLMTSNLPEWVQKDFVPALKKAGVNTNDPQEIINAATKATGNTNAARLVSFYAMAGNIGRLNRNAGIVGRGMGVSDAFANMQKNDPSVVLNNLKAALTNLGVTVGRVITPIVIPAIKGLTAAIQGLANFFDKHQLVAGITTFASSIAAAALGLRWFGVPIGPIARGLGALSMRLVPLRVLMVGARYGFMAALGVAGPFAAAIAAIGVALAFVIAKWDGIKAFFAGFGEGFKKALSPEARKDIAEFVNFLRPIGSLFSWIGSEVMALVGWIGKLFGPANTANWKSWGDTVGQIVGWVADKIIKLAHGIRYVWDVLAGGSFGAKVPKPASAPKIAGARASGGPVTAGKPWLVGERGPELFVPNSHGTVIPHSEMARRRAMKGGGVQFRDIVIHDAHDPHATARAVRAEIDRLGREQDGYLSD